MDWAQSVVKAEESPALIELSVIRSKMYLGCLIRLARFPLEGMTLIQ